MLRDPFQNHGTNTPYKLNTTKPQTNYSLMGHCSKIHQISSPFAGNKCPCISRPCYGTKIIIHLCDKMKHQIAQIDNLRESHNFGIGIYRKSLNSWQHLTYIRLLQLCVTSATDHTKKTHACHCVFINFLGSFLLAGYKFSYTSLQALCVIIFLYIRYIYIYHDGNSLKSTQLGQSKTTMA